MGRVDLQRAVTELPPQIEAMRDEVAQLQAVQSSIEAENLQDADLSRKEILRLQHATARASENAKEANEQKAAAESQLADMSDEAARQASRWSKYAIRCEELEREASIARQLIKEIRQQCIETRGSCSNAVDRLHEMHRVSISRCDRGCSPMPDSRLANLTNELELCMQRARTLEADNEAVRTQRRREADL